MRAADGSILIRPIASIDARLDPGPWAWADDNREAIAAHWRRIGEGRPGMFNGRVLLCCDIAITGRDLSLRYRETDYAAFLACRDMGWPDDTIANCFAMAALRAADGAFLLGEMGARTANAGRIYFPAGTPDRDDVTPSGAVDLAGSVFRELEEETGLAPADVTACEGWTLVRDGPKVALMREVRSPLPAAALAARIGEFLSSEPEPELAAMHVAFRAGDIPRASMPPFMAAFLDHALPG